MVNMIEEKSEQLLEQSLGWIRYLDSKKEIKNPYVLNLDGVFDFIYKNK